MGIFWISISILSSVICGREVGITVFAAAVALENFPASATLFSPLMRIPTRADRENEDEDIKGKLTFATRHSP